MCIAFLNIDISMKGERIFGAPRRKSSQKPILRVKYILFLCTGRQYLRFLYAWDSVSLLLMRHAPLKASESIE